MSEHNDFGHQGEVLAQNLLTQKGYKIIDTNWRYGHNEVDIIAQKDDIIVFVEVKTRSTTVFGEPESFVTREKQKAYIRLANHYIERYNRLEEVRFDIISIVINRYKNEIKHIEGAFSAIMR